MIRRNFRKIVIDDKIYKWRFNSIIQICPEGLYNNMLSVDFGFYDSWIYVNDKGNEPENFEPQLLHQLL